MTRFAKYAFGNLAVVGDEPDLWVEGVFMWMGKSDNPKEYADHPSSEFYKKR